MSQKERNPIWQYFDKSTTDLSKASCKVCKKYFSLGSSEPKKQTVHGLKQHFSKFHDEEYRKVLKRQSEKDDEENEARIKRVNSKFSRNIPQMTQLTIPTAIASKSVQWPEDHEISKRIDKAIMDLIIVDMLPYSLVKGEAFRRLNFTDPLAVHKYRIKSEKFFRTSLLPKTYETVKSKVKNLIAKCEWLSATTDIWTNPSKSCSLLSFTGHLIIEHRRLKVVLGAAVLEQDHTGSYIEEKLTEMVNEWNLNGKIFLVLRDNAPNMVCAMRGHYESIGCVSHTLHLVIKRSLFSDGRIKEIIKRSRHIVGHFHHSETASRKLQLCQNQCNLPVRTLVQDIDVRWNSTYLMLQRLYEQKRAVNLYSVEYGGVDTLKPPDWDIVKHLVDILKYFYEATLTLSSDKESISVIIPLFSLLKRTLSSLSDIDNEVLKEMVKSLQKNFIQKLSFVEQHSTLMAATLLDPRFKSKYFTSDEVEIAITEIISFLKGYNENISVSSPSTVESALSSDVETQLGSLWDMHDNTKENDEKTAEGTKEIEPTPFKQVIQCYLSEPRLQRNADVYSYWNSSPYPSLRKAVLKYLSAPPTSVPSEQLFSAAGQIYADRRSNLLGENAEKLLFLSYNIRLFNFEY